MNLWLIFLTGLTVGGLTCIAVQGGLLASVIAAKESDELGENINPKSTVIPTLSFLVAKLIAYTILGFLLGTFGVAVSINQTVQIVIQLLAGFYMVAIALNLLDIHPIFKYAVIQPPHFLTRKLKSQSRSKDVFAPAILGAMTIFIPCGTTLAMAALAISGANAFYGAAIMAVFTLGTSPLFFGIGWLTGILGDNFRGKFLKVAALAVIYLGLTSINGALIALDFPLNSQNIVLVLTQRQKLEGGGSNEIQTNQNLEIIVASNGYSPNYFRVKKGELVTVKVVSKEAYGCASAFRVPSLGVIRNLQVNETFTFTFTPEKAGAIRFTCAMGMYSGTIEVI